MNNNQNIIATKTTTAKNKTPRTIITPSQECVKNIVKKPKNITITARNNVILI